MKISDASIEYHEGKVVICHKNKRGNIKSDYVDITKDFLDRITQVLVSEDDKIIIHTDKTGKHYTVNVTEMSQEEYDRRAKGRETRGQKTMLSLGSLLLPLMMRGLK